MRRGSASRVQRNARCAMCQAVGRPFSAEYWQSGESYSQKLSTSSSLSTMKQRAYPDTVLELYSTYLQRLEELGDRLSVRLRVDSRPCRGDLRGSEVRDAGGGDVHALLRAVGHDCLR